MALLKSFEVPENGTTGNYWKVVRSNKDYVNKRCNFTLSLYVNKQARDNSKKSIHDVNGFITIDDMSSDERKAIYEALKSDVKIVNNTVFFEDAGDC